MKRLGLWTTAVLAILLVAPIARASAAERPSYSRTASAMSTFSMTASVLAEPAASGGWTDEDTVGTVGIGVLAALGGTLAYNRTRSDRYTRNSEEHEREVAKYRQDQQRDELMLNTLDDVLAAVDTYLLLRKPGETAEKSVVRDVISGLYRFQRLAGSPPIKRADDFRQVVAAALTRDLDSRAKPEPIQVRVDGQSLPIPSDAASLSDLIHRMADELRKDISRRFEATSATDVHTPESREQGIVTPS
jgi:hypothetical protein